MTPFYIIRERSIYALRTNMDLILSDILNTYDNYSNNIDVKYFNEMIYKLTSQGNSSLLSNNSDVTILNTICVLYPNLLNADNVDKIIFTFDIKTHTFKWVNVIQNTGYQFTQKQLLKLGTIGYFTMFDKLETLTLDELMLIINPIDTPQSIFNKFINSDKEKFIDHIIIIIDRLCKKYNICLPFDKINGLLEIFKNNSYHHVNIRTLINFIKLMSLNNELFTRENFMYILTTYNICNSIPSDIPILKDIFNRFSDNTLNRNDINKIIQCEHGSTKKISMLLDTNIINYCYDIDMYYNILDSYGNYNHVNDTFNTFVDKKNIRIDDKCIFLASLSHNNEKCIINCIGSGVELTDILIRCIYTFTTVSSMIHILQEHKIYPSLTYVKCCTDLNIIKYIKNNILFIDDDVLKYCNDILNVESYTRISPYKIEDDIFADIYTSVSSIDRKKIERMSYKMISKAKYIIMYNITLTPIYVKYILYYDWIEIPKLLFATNKYQYITDYIDMNIIQYMPDNIGRIWIYNNVLNNDYNFFDTRYIIDNSSVIDEDIDILLRSEVIHDINIIHEHLENQKNNRLHNIYKI